MFDTDIYRFHFILRRASFVYNDWVSNVSGAAFCSIQKHRIVPCQLTLTRTDFLHVHQSTISADKDVSAKNINFGRGSYGPGS